MSESNISMSGLYRRATLALTRGDARNAHKICLQILHEDRTHSDAWYLCAVIAGQNAEHAKALKILDTAISLNPSRAEYFTEQGKCHLALQEMEKAHRAAQSALALAPSNIPTLNDLGTLFSRCNDQSAATKCFATAARKLKARANNETGLSAEFQAEVYFNFSSALRFEGDLQRAVEYCEEAISANTSYFRAHWALATLRKQSAEHNHIARLSGLMPSVKTPQDQMYLGHAVAKEQEDLGKYPEALDSLRWAKKAYKKNAAYHYEQDAEVIDFLVNRPVESTGRASISTQQPIFVVGMPRTGTTLVEQILGSHSKVSACGELQNFPRAVQHIANNTAAEPISLQVLDTAYNKDISDLGKRYFDSVRNITGNACVFTDKLPLNFLYIGLIVHAIPNAKIICLRRDPMDTCLSNYRQLFASKFRYYDYNLDLIDCGKYFVGFDKLMNHWHSSLPGKILDLDYEKLVAQPTKSINALLEYCDLDWEDNCLEFSKHVSHVTTASAVQVRQEIYTSAIGRWRKYGSAVQPLYEFLQAAGYYKRGFLEL